MSTEDIKSRVAATRAELESTLDAIEDKLNLPKRASELGKRAAAAYEKNPLPWIAGATAVVIGVIGVIAWALLGDD